VIIPLQPLQATKEEIEKLKSLVRRPMLLGKKRAQDVIAPTVELPKVDPSEDLKTTQLSTRSSSLNIFNGGLQHIEVTMEPLKFDNPVEMWTMLKPDITLYRWQFETLMQVAGYTRAGKYQPEDKVKVDKEHVYRLLLSAANGSGKDAIVIAAAAVWYALTGLRNRVIITSSSFEQVKFQTEPAITDLKNCINQKFGVLFKSVQFHHTVPKLGSEIKIFATDDAGHAEGYHSWGTGGVMRIINEAKSVQEDIFKATSRWTGVTHDLCVSSPGKKSGTMFKRVADSVLYPNDVELNKWFFRRVTAFECKHIATAHIQEIFYTYGENSPHTKSVIFAEFSDYDEPVIISEEVWDKLFNNPPPWTGHDIGIGLDLAGGGDEDAGVVRQGNKVIHSFFFRQKDTDLASDLIDMQLEPWKTTDYVFNADNGGLGQAILDKLAQKGWNIQRRNNQSPAFDKRQFLNLGAEVWHHVKRLMERRDIILPGTVGTKFIDKLKAQVISRHWEGLESTQGKFSLEPKKHAIASGRPSPDRADAFNLCFFSYRPNRITVANSDRKEEKFYITTEQLLKLAQTGELFRAQLKTDRGLYTIMNTKNI